MSSLFPLQIDSPSKVLFDGSYNRDQLESASTQNDDDPRAERVLRKNTNKLARLTRALYAGRQRSVLFVFQAMDAAGKDGTIRTVFSGLDPQALHTASFKAPTDTERRHDMFWRTNPHLPARGCISIFNRSYYEEVLVVKVHPEYLGGQYPGGVPNLDELWTARYRAIREHEAHLEAAGTIVIKFWLQVSADEQRRRFLSRLEEPRKQWKFNPGDLREAGHRDAYMEAVVEMLNETSRPAAPWFVIAADNKDRMRAEVSTIALQALQAAGPRYPAADEDVLANVEKFRKQLQD